MPAPTADVDEIGEAYLQGSGIFMSANTAWAATHRSVAFRRAVDAVRTLDPQLILPTHGAPLKGRTAALCDHLTTLPASEPFAFPNDAGFREMLAQMAQMQPGGAAEAAA